MSTPHTWAQVQSIFHEALSRPAEARDLFLAEACLGDAALEAEVRSLLAAHEDDGMIALIDDTPGTPRLFGLENDRIGPYRILRPLGQGGMGMVFLATREEHDVSQTVALKLLRADFVDPGVIERFRAERRILARLEHPGIARLITAGATEAGQPFFAMEFVEGTSLLDHCRRNRCTLDERLALFLEVCDAVEYAHQQLVVHRDLKPGNILVTEEGRAKLLDFGVAKLLDADESATGTTRTGGWFTPEYASPEQLRRQPVTTLSDVYALGVVLYELLAGVRPFDLRGLSPASIEHTLTHETPARPSDRAMDTRVGRLVRGDLDTIILKALAADPARRYASVRELADDVRRFRANEPVRARPDRWTYRAAKFVRRHRVGVAAAAITLVSLVGALGAVTWQATVAARARDRAEQALAESQSVSQFLAELFQAADPSRVAGDTGAARAILRQGVARVEGLSAQPVVQARMLDALGMVFVNLGEYERARGFIVRGLELRRQSLDPLHPDIAVSLQHHGRALRALSRYAEAESAYVSALALVRQAGQAETPLAAEILGDLGYLMPYLSRDDDAERYYREMLELERSLRGDRHPAVAEAILRLGGIHRRRGEYARAESLFREVVFRHRRDVGSRDPLTATALFHLGDLIILVGGDTAEAEAMFREGIDVYRNTPAAVTGGIHGLGSLARLQSGRRRHAEAEALLRENLALSRSVYGSGGPAVAGATEGLAAELARQERYTEAIALERQALELWKQAVGSEHAAVASSQHLLARMLMDARQYAEAESLFIGTIGMRRRLHGTDTPVGAVVIASLGELQFRLRRYSDAESTLVEALTIFRRFQRDEHEDVRMVYGLLAAVHEATGLLEEAARYRMLAAAPGRDGG
jgi:serine/threonine-protein kinase